MPGINGIELVEAIRDRTRFLIFNTSHSKFALTAFALKATQYLLKPFPLAKFISTIHHIISDLTPAITIEKSNFKYIKGDSKHDFHSIDFQHVTYIQADRNYIKLRVEVEQSKLLLRMGINEIEKILVPPDFIRISRCVIISTKHIKKVIGSKIILKVGQGLAIGLVYKNPFLDYMYRNMLK